MSDDPYVKFTRLKEERHREAAQARRKKNLLMEYEFIKDYKVVLQSPTGGRNTAYRVEELFEMFELVRNRNESQY